MSTPEQTPGPPCPNCETPLRHRDHLLRRNHNRTAITKIKKTGEGMPGAAAVHPHPPFLPDPVGVASPESGTAPSPGPGPPSG